MQTKKLMQLTTILIAFLTLTITSQAQNSTASPTSEGESVQIKKTTADECARAFAENKAKDDVIAGMEKREAESAAVIQNQREIIVLSQKEAADLRAAITELIKNIPKKSKCVLFCVNF